MNRNLTGSWKEGVETNKFRHALLPDTLRWAITKSPYYNQVIPRTTLSKVRFVSDLSLLPIIDKMVLRKKSEDFICKGLTLHKVQFTSGTTGKPLLMYRSVEEAVNINRFFSGVAKVSRPYNLSLAISEVYHGTPTSIPSAGVVITSGAVDDGSFMQNLDIIRKRFCFKGVSPRISSVTGTDTSIRLLTHYAKKTGMDPLKDSEIKVLSTHGDFIPQKVKHVVEGYWNAPFVDRYSMTEVFGGATSIGHSDIYIFDPTLIPEVLDIKNNANITKGVGKLCLTTLFPFTLMMPLLRYQNEDLVEIENTDENYSNLTFRIKGRMSDTVFFAKGGVSYPVIFPADILNLLFSIPQIMHRGRRIDLKFPGAAVAAGKPVYAVNTDFTGRKLPKITIEVVVDFDPQVHPQRADMVRNRIINGLLEANQDLRRFVETRSLGLVASLLPPSKIALKEEK